MPPLQLLEDEISRKLAEAMASGELQAAASYGKPLAEDEGWQHTPEALRMGFKILKNAGFAPPELALFQQRAQLRAELAAAGLDPARAQTLRLALSALEQKLSLRLDSLRRHGTL